MKRLLLSFLLGLVTFAMAAQGPSMHISGVVTDDNGEPLIGAGVIVSGTTTGVTTDAEGRFSMEVKPGTTLEIVFLGMETKTIKVQPEKSFYEINLSFDSKLLEEVVVVGYDVQKKVNLTGSVSTISTDNFINRPIVQASSALQGMAAGVTVTTRTGEPGSDGGTIRIRGLGTFGGSSAEPLVLIDGVEGNMNALDVSLIDKITVLKDAASSAIYGNRAANGVILITTKRASKGHSSVTYRGYTGWQEPTNVTENVTAEEYMLLRREADMNDGKASIYTDEYIAAYRDNNAIDPDGYPITDWKGRILTGSGFTHGHSLSLSAGSEKIRVMTSLGYMSQDGIVKHTAYQRYSVRNNMDVELSKKLHMKFDLALTYGNKKTNPGQSTLFTQMNVSDPLNLTQWSTGGYPTLTGGSVNSLPYLEGQGGNNKSNTYRLNGNFTLTFDPVDWITLEGIVSPRYIMSEGHVFRDKIVFWTDPFGTVSSSSNVVHNSLSESCTRSFYGNYYAKMILHRTFAKSHNVRLLLGASYEDWTQKTLSAYRQDYAYPQYDVISAGADDETKGNDGRIYQYAYGSFFGRINYNFKERYLFETNLRYDGSSRFAKENRWAPFMSYSAAWRLSEEPWMHSLKNVLTEIKLRGSYGTLGNQNISSSYYPTSQNLALGSFSVNETIQPIATLTTLANPALTWEESAMYDIGIDFSLWNKFSVTADWYHKTTDGILMKLDIPATIGLGAPYQNAGSVRNIGWEVAVSYNDAAGDFHWGIDANLSDVNNRILNMNGTTTGGSSGLLVNEEGQEINSIRGLTCLGMVRTQEEADIVNNKLPQYNTIVKPGDLYYADWNKDGKVDDNDKHVIGGTIPHYTYGVTLNFGWKSLSLSAFFQGVGKVDSYLSGYYVMPCYQGGTFRKEHLDRWTPETPNGRFPRLTYTEADINQKPSTFWLADASYCRLKNLQLSYNLPSKLVKKTGMKSVMLFANAQNLLTFTKFWQGYDPEVAYNGSAADGVEIGMVASNYPQVRTYTFGIDIKF
jgi:TonB-linked SusC/RagA family outer membrane protein